MNVVCKVPVSVGALSAQAVRIHGGMNRPGMDLRQWKIFVDKCHPVAVLLEQLWKQCAMYLRAEWTLEVVVTDNRDLRIRIPANRPALHVDFLHDLGIRIFAQIHFGHANERLLVLGDQKIIGLLLRISVEGDGYSVIVRKLAGMGRGNNDLDAGRHVVSNPKLPFDALRKFSRSKLRRAAETDQQEEKNHAFARNHQKPPEHCGIARLSHRESGPPLLLPEDKLFGGKERVHRSRAEASEIERDKLKPKGLKNSAEFRCHFLVERARHLFSRNLDAGDVPVMPHSELPESKVPKRVLSLFDGGESFSCNRPAVLDTRRKACRRRFVPDAQPAIPREVANLLLGESGLDERCGNPVLRRRHLPRAEIAFVVEIHTISDGRESSIFRKCFHHSEEFVLAMKATRGIVTHVFFPVEFVSANDFKRNALLVREGDCIRKLKPGKTGRVGNYRQHLVAKRLMSSPGEERGIRPARIRNQRATQGAQIAIENVALARQFRRNGHVNIL